MRMITMMFERSANALASKCPRSTENSRQRPRRIRNGTIDEYGLLVWINRQTVAGDLFSMNPNRDDAVVRVHAF